MHSAGYLCMYIITHVWITHLHVTSQELLTALTANPLDVSDQYREYYAYTLQPI